MSKSLFSKANDELVEALIAARRSTGLRQADVAKRLGKHQSYISNIERGQRRIDVLEFYMLARALNVDPAELFSSAIKSFPDIIDI